ncbi:MAG TPA: NAD(P)/FAD-dependent oxidoreductase [Rhizomicrobium sp.]|nr:NAD(P)/FAD-dependent oxidoreductase [Rhizomicrobium sp.]
MSRTPIMDFLKQATRAAAREVLEQSPASGAFTSRRDILLGGSAAAASLFIPAPAGAAEAKIAIVGAGLAGLTAAFRLKHRYGLNADVFEGNTRVGGRCFTARGIFANNQIAEHGGELIDTDQHSIRRLAGELGLKLTNVLKATPPGTHEFYMFNGEPYNLSDATTDWMPVFHRVHHQNKKIGNPSYLGATDAALHWDSLSISQWVARTIPGGRKSKLGQLIENAFTEENALDADKQSAICSIQALALDKIDNFNLYYTASNQTFHIEGGNDQIATIIANDLGARLKTALALIAIRQLADGRFRLTFASSTSQFDVTYDRVILTVPFSVMRVGVDFSKAGFSDLKVQSINSLLMGASCKTQLQFTERQWFKVGCNGEIRTPAVGFDTTWDVTRGQPGKSGIFNFFAGGTQAIQAGEMDDNQLALLLMQEAEPLIPGLSALWNGLMIKNAWQFNPWSYGSYSTYQPGYQTTLLGIEKVPEGNCFFAGEHTEVQNGFLDAAVQSGDRVAKEVAESLGTPAALFSAATY